jgi:hypothetical protein
VSFHPKFLIPSALIAQLVERVTSTDWSMTRSPVQLRLRALVLLLVRDLFFGSYSSRGFFSMFLFFKKKIGVLDVIFGHCIFVSPSTYALLLGSTESLGRIVGSVFLISIESGLPVYYLTS